MAQNVVVEHNKLLPREGNRSVCYFLGAGFSAATSYKYPTSVGFLTRADRVGVPRFLSDETVPDEPESLGEIRYDGDRYGGMLDRVEERYGDLQCVNIEDVLTDLYVRTHGIGGSWEDAERLQLLQRDYETILHFIMQRLFVRGANDDCCELTERLLGCLRDKDSIITLNYDLAIELVLATGVNWKARLRNLEWLISAPANAPSSDVSILQRAHDISCGTLFKLHGSVDWRACPNAICPCYFHIETVNEWYLYHRPRFVGSRCRVCGRELEPVIIPPIAAKSFERYPRLNLLWNGAFEALRDSARWVFLGVSFAKTDFHLSSLLGAAYEASRSFGGRSPESAPAQICVVSRNLDSAWSCACRLVAALPPIMRQQNENGEVIVSLFESIERYVAEAAGGGQSASDAGAGS